VPECCICAASYLLQSLTDILLKQHEHAA
jgi:hypothetical protein